MTKHCPICFGIGWFCENHPDKPWDQDLGCECGAGMPCECNDADEPDLGGIVIQEEHSTKH
jgi:hypothetical protein